MLFEAVAQWYDTATTGIHACATAHYGNPGALDMVVTYPTFQNTGELVFWVQVAASGTSGTDTYQFILRGSATTDGTDLNGTVVDLVTSPTYTQSGTFCLKTDPTKGLFAQEVPAIAQSYRYWQLYINASSVAGNMDLTIFSGISLRSALPVRVSSIVGSSDVTFP